MSKELFKSIKESFKNATEELLNGEEAIDFQMSKEGKKTIVYFTVDCDRYGMYTGNYVTFHNGDIKVTLCERVEYCGIEEMMIDDLKSVTV